MFSTFTLQFLNASKKYISTCQGIIDVRSSSLEEKENNCGVVSGTLDVTSKKCNEPDQVCCRHPNFDLPKCPDILQPHQSPDQDWSHCGRNASGYLVLTGEDESYRGRQYEAQPGEFPHTCIVYRVVNVYRNYIGGATLIAPNLVLTVAHKFYNM